MSPPSDEDFPATLLGTTTRIDPGTRDPCQFSSITEVDNEDESTCEGSVQVSSVRSLDLAVELPEEWPTLNGTPGIAAFVLRGGMTQRRPASTVSNAFKPASSESLSTIKLTPQTRCQKSFESSCSTDEGSQSSHCAVGLTLPIGCTSHPAFFLNQPSVDTDTVASLDESGSLRPDDGSRPSSEERRPLGAQLRLCTTVKPRIPSTLDVPVCSPRATSSRTRPTPQPLQPKKKVFATPKLTCDFYSTGTNTEDSLLELNLASPSSAWSPASSDLEDKLTGGMSYSRTRSDDRSASVTVMVGTHIYQDQSNFMANAPPRFSTSFRTDTYDDFVGCQNSGRSKRSGKSTRSRTKSHGLSDIALSRRLLRNCTVNTGLSFEVVGEDAASAFAASKHQAPGMLTPMEDGCDKDQVHPLIASHPEVSDCIKLIRGDALSSLSVPVPRCQDLPESCFGTPGHGDIVVAISHAWRNQAHPDPCGHTLKQAVDLAAQLKAGLKDASVFFFFDFVSVPQRAFRNGQPGRTAAEARAFANALKLMHFVYFYADGTMHVSNERMTTTVPGEGEVYEVAGKHPLNLATFEQVGARLQIASVASEVHTPFDQGHEEFFDTNGQAVTLAPSVAPKPFDQVMQVNGTTPESLDSLCNLHTSDQCSVAWQLKRLPYGQRSDTPSHERGWIFLERFITMTKVALLDESVASKTVITNSRRISEQINHGADQLRAAARAEQRLQNGEFENEVAANGPLCHVLERFLHQLADKKFSPVSADKASNLAKVRSGDDGSDRTIVATIMKEFVDHLRTHWHEERKQLLKRTRSSVFEAMENSKGLSSPAPTRSSIDGALNLFKVVSRTSSPIPFSRSWKPKSGLLKATESMSRRLVSLPAQLRSARLQRPLAHNTVK